MKRRAMRLEWSAFAQADRDAIFDYIDADSPRAAVTVDERICDQLESLYDPVGVVANGDQRDCGAAHAG